MSSYDGKNKNKRSIKEWVLDNKIGTIACVWVSTITGSLWYQFSMNKHLSTSMKIVQTRVYAQAITLAAMAGAAAVEYYDDPNRAQQQREPEFLKLEADDD